MNGALALRRRAVVEALLADRGELLVVSGLGAPAWDAAAAGDHPLTFPLWGPWAGRFPWGWAWPWPARSAGSW